MVYNASVVTGYSRATNLQKQSGNRHIDERGSETTTTHGMMPTITGRGSATIHKPGAKSLTQEINKRRVIFL